MRPAIQPIALPAIECPAGNRTTWRWRLPSLAALCSYYVHESGARAQALNAIAPIPPDAAAAERTARHLGMLRELAELGMALARAAAQQALEDRNRTPEEAIPAPAPGASAGGRAGSARPGRDPNLAFARLSSAVRQTIALEARIAAGDLGPAAQRRATRAAADPRLTAIRRILHMTADAETDAAARKALRRDIDERLDDLSETDPDGERSAEAIIDEICDELGLSLDLSRLPDELLDAVCPPVPSPPVPSPAAPGHAVPSPGAPWPGAGQPDAVCPDALCPDAVCPDAGRETRSPLRPSGPDPP